MSFNPSTVANEITFGIEIECFIPTNAVAPNGNLVRNRMVGYHRVGNFDAVTFDGWSATSDCSLRTSLSGYMPVEFVSPILKGQDGLRQVREIFAWLNSIDARVNRTCGQHIHIGVRSGSGSDNGDEQAHWVANLMGLTSQYEDAMYAMTGSPYRASNSYCATIKGSDHYKQAADATKAASKRAGRKTDTLRNNYFNRTATLNLTNVFSRRTVEFRWGGGTVNVAKAMMHIGVALGLAELARSNRGTSFTLEPGKATTRVAGRSIPEAQVDALISRLGWITAGGPNRTAKGWIGTEVELKATRRQARRLAKKFVAAGGR